MAKHRCEFTIILCGFGESPAECWEDAIDSFHLEPGEPELPTKVEVEQTEDMEDWEEVETVSASRAFE